MSVLERTQVNRELESGRKPPLCLHSGGEVLALTRSSRIVMGKSNMHILTGWARALCRLNRDLVSMLHRDRSSPPLKVNTGIKGGKNKGNSPRRISPSAFHWRLRGFTGKKKKRNPSLRRRSFQVPTTALPLPRPVFPPPSSSSAPSPGNVVTGGSCLLVSQSSGGIAQPLSCCATAAVRFPSCDAQAKGPQHRLPHANQLKKKKNDGEPPPGSSSAAAI